MNTFDVVNFRRELSRICDSHAKSIVKMMQSIIPRHLSITILQNELNHISPTPAGLRWQVNLVEVNSILYIKVLPTRANHVTNALEAQFLQIFREPLHTSISRDYEVIYLPDTHGICKAYSQVCSKYEFDQKWNLPISHNKTALCELYRVKITKWKNPHDLLREKHASELDKLRTEYDVKIHVLELKMYHLNTKIKLNESDAMVDYTVIRNRNKKLHSELRRVYRLFRTPTC